MQEGRGEDEKLSYLRLPTRYQLVYSDSSEAVVSYMSVCIHAHWDGSGLNDSDNRMDSREELEAFWGHNVWTYVKKNLGLFYMCIAKSKTASKSLQRKHVIEILRMESQKTMPSLNHKKQTRYRTQK